MADEMSSRPQPDGQIKWDDPNQPADAGPGQSGAGQGIQGTEDSSRGRRHHQYQDTPGGQSQQGGYDQGQQGGYQGQQGGQQGGYQGQQGGYDPGQQGGYDPGQQGGQQGGYDQSQQGGYDQGQQGGQQGGRQGGYGGQQGGYDQGQPGGYQGQPGGQQGGYGGHQGGYQGHQGGQPGGYQSPQGGPGTFDLNDPQQRQAAQQWLQQFQGGNTQQLPQHDLGNMFQGWANQAEPQHVVDATAHAVEQMPPQQRAGFVQSITGWLQQHGISPAQAGIKTTDPAQMSPQDVGNLVGYAQKQNPDIIKQLFSSGGLLSNPVVQVGLAGLLAYAASQAFKRPGQ